MGSESSLNAGDRLVGTLNRQAAQRASTRDCLGTTRRDSTLLGTTGFYGDSVYDAAGKFLGEIEELVLDIDTGRVAYALVAVGAFLGMGRKLVAIPWSTVAIDRVYQRCVISIELERLIDAPALDGDLLPRMADPGWAKEVHAHFGCKPYWE